MELTAEQFEQITGLTHEAPIYDGVEKRRHPRVTFGSRARIYPLIPAICPNGRSVLVRDISLGGVGLLFSDPLAVGDEFYIQLPTLHGETLVIHCMTQHCETGGSHGKQFVIGAAFEQVLDASVLTDDSMLDSPLVKSAMANLSSTWRGPAGEDKPAPTGPITRAVTSVWKRLTGLTACDAQPNEKIRERLAADQTVTVNFTPAIEPTFTPRRGVLFASSETPAAVIEAPAVAVMEAPAPVAAPIVAAPLPAPVAVVEVAAPVVQTVEIAAPKIEAVQDSMWMPEVATSRITARPRATVHRMGTRHPRRRFGRAH